MPPFAPGAGVAPRPTEGAGKVWNSVTAPEGRRGQQFTPHPPRQPAVCRVTLSLQDRDLQWRLKALHHTALHRHFCVDRGDIRSLWAKEPESIHIT